MDNVSKKRIEIRGGLTLPRVVLQMCLQGEIPSKDLIGKAIESLDKIVMRLQDEC